MMLATTALHKMSCFSRFTFRSVIVVAFLLVVLLLAPKRLSAKKMAKQAAGFVIFRVINDSIEYLLLQTSYGNHHWTPPKGHVDKGESSLVTAYRETEEEAHIEKSQIQVIDVPPITAQYLVMSKPKIVYYYLAMLLNPHQNIKLSEEHQSFKWCNFETSLDLVVYDEMKHVLTTSQEILAKLNYPVKS